MYLMSCIGDRLEALIVWLWHRKKSVQPHVAAADIAVADSSGTGGLIWANPQGAAIHGGGEHEICVRTDRDRMGLVSRIGQEIGKDTIISVDAIIIELEDRDLIILRVDAMKMAVIWKQASQAQAFNR